MQALPHEESRYKRLPQKPVPGAIIETLDKEKSLEKEFDLLVTAQYDDILVRDR